ncbi:MAG TPA: S1C family serine protease [Micropepsaceae bacterium]|nr:S1C family serine protease [Micropepsaceae bacterium]
MAAASLLTQFSDELTALVDAAGSFAGQIRSESTRPITAILWTQDAVVTSEQILAEAPEYEVRISGQTVRATLAGRDPGTNVAVLRLQTAVTASLPPASDAKSGALAIVIGNGGETLSAHLDIIRSAGGAWESMAGSTIDRRILLAGRIGSDEGGPVLSAGGGLFGMSTRGARRSSLVIPASTIARAVTTLMEKGSVERGWLGVALRPVALPETLRPAREQRSGMMVMDVSDGSPAAKAGVVAGDIILSADNLPAIRYGAIARQLGARAIGKKIALAVARAGAVVTVDVTVEARPA